MKEKRNKRKLSHILAALCYAMALVSLLSSFGATLAKYAKKDSTAGAAVAAPFYFSSDKLRDDNRLHTIPEPAAGQSVTVEFTLSNFIDDLRCTEEKIEYEYYAVAGADPGGMAITQVYTGELEGFQQSSAQTLTLSKSDFSTGSTVTVVAKATKPYQKTLSARFSFDRQLQTDFDIRENEVILEVAGGSGDPVTVAWLPEKVTPDRSNALFNDASDRSVTFTAQPGVRYALVFFRTGQPVSEEDFSVTLS